MVVVYGIIGIWSIDVAYIHKLAKYNNEVKYFLLQ